MKAATLSPRLREPMDVLAEAPGSSLSAWAILRACYGSEVVDGLRRGNAGRLRAIGRILDKAGAIPFAGPNGATHWGKPTGPA